MKPTKNRVMCPDCGRQKMLFETERKANDFIKWNAEDIVNGQYLRAYYCPACCGWHISHHRHNERYDTQTDNLIGAFNRSKKSHSRLERILRGEFVRETVENEMSVAKQIYAAIPEDIKGTGKKSRIREFMNSYFEENGFDDHGGRIKGHVYKLFREDMMFRFNK